jgi:hypothetical protein
LRLEKRMERYSDPERKNAVPINELEQLKKQYLGLETQALAPGLSPTERISALNKMVPLKDKIAKMEADQDRLTSQ